MYIEGFIRQGPQRGKCTYATDLDPILICHFQPITSMEICPHSIPVKKGDFLSMKSFYNGASHEL
jgi:hypothetical protein